MKKNITTTSPSSDTEVWVKTVTAAGYLGISVPTIHRWIKAGRIKPRRTPTGAYRFRRSELDTVLD